MGEVLRAISPDEHDAFYREIYSSGEGGLVFSQFRVSMDTDPTLNPKGINEKIAKVQGLKDRLVVIYNRAIKNKNYWDTVTKKIASRFESAYQKAMTLEEVKKAGNAESRVAAATEKAKQDVLTNVFKGDGTYDDRVSNIASKNAEAISFFLEVKNIYENLDSTSMNLAIQLKSVMLNARIYGDGFGVGNKQGGDNGGGTY